MRFGKGDALAAAPFEMPAVAKQGWIGVEGGRSPGSAVLQNGQVRMLRELVPLTSKIRCAKTSTTYKKALEFPAIC